MLYEFNKLLKRCCFDVNDSRDLYYEEGSADTACLSVASTNLNRRNFAKWSHEYKLINSTQDFQMWPRAVSHENESRLSQTIKQTNLLSAEQRSRENLVSVKRNEKCKPVCVS